jgi:hypothetical protein
MKAFVIAALLVASVAAQNLDIMDLMKEKSLLKTRPFHTRSTVEDLLLKEKLGGQQYTDSFYPSTINSGVYDDLTSSIFGGRVQQDEIIPVEELMTIPLFREYMRIPLFRQFLVQHPVVFRRYVESPLFQKFWTMPQFQMYFRNPVLFYKYIVPQIQVISEVVPTTTEGIYNYNYDTVSPYGYNKEWTVPMNMNMRNNMGIMGKTFPFGRMTTSTTTNPMHYKYLLEKMMEQLRFNKVHQGVSETFTDVKQLPTGDIVEHTVGEIVDPFTGEKRITPGDFKYVNEKIVPFTSSMDFQGMDSTYGMNKNIYGLPTSTLKDALVKHILLNKIFGQRVMKPTLYESLMGKELTSTLFPHLMNKKVWTPELLSTIFSSKVLNHPEMTDSLFSTHKTITPEIFESVFGEHKAVLTPEIYELLVKGKKDVLSPRVLENIFGKKIYNPEILRTLFNTHEITNKNMNIFGGEELEFEPLTTLKNKMLFNPLVTRMLRNKMMVPEMKQDILGLKTLEMIKKEKMIEELRKERIVEDLIKNKDLYTIDSEIPKMMETEKFQKVPLTFGKPFFGSQIDEFTKEKEIKF